MIKAACYWLIFDLRKLEHYCRNFSVLTMWKIYRKLRPILGRIFVPIRPHHLLLFFLKCAPKLSVYSVIPFFLLSTPFCSNVASPGECLIYDEFVRKSFLQRTKVLRVRINNWKFYFPVYGNPPPLQTRYLTKFFDAISRHRLVFIFEFTLNNSYIPLDNPLPKNFRVILVSANQKSIFKKWRLIPNFNV